MAQDPLQPRFNMKAASQMAGVSEHTLRAWEKRYQAVAPERTESGHRLYSQKEVERIRLLDRLVRAGHSISGIAQLPDAALERLADQKQSPAKLDTRTAAPASSPGSPHQERRPHDPKESHLIESLITGLEEFRTEWIDRELHHARTSRSARDFIFSVVAPLLARVGEEVERDRVSIAQEHALSAILRDHLGHVFRSLLPQGGVSDFLNRERATAALGSSGGGTSKVLLSGTFSRDRVILAALEGDLHEFGILMSAVLCAMNRLTTHYLGPNLPVADLARAAEQLGVGLIILGVAPLPVELRKRPLVDELVELDRLLPPHVQVWVGGGGWSDETLHADHPNAGAAGSSQSLAFAWRKRFKRLHSLENLDELLAEWREGYHP